MAGKKMQSSAGYFNKEMQAILNKADGNKASKTTTKKSKTTTKKKNK